MSDTAPLSSWSHATTDIPDRGLSRERAVSDAERGDIARALKLISLDKLVATYRISSISGGAWRLAGPLRQSRRGAAAGVPLPLLSARAARF